MTVPDRGYFVPLAPPPPPSARSVTAPVGARPGGSALDPRSSVPDPPRRRRNHFQVRFWHVLALAFAVWLAWASSTEGGVSARVNDAIEDTRAILLGATTDPGLKRAANYYNARYAREGSYPRLTEEEQRDDPDAGFGVGVSVQYCSARAVVLQSLTGSGTISRLLLDGQDLGDVKGDADCPVDLNTPRPWSFSTTG